MSDPAMESKEELKKAIESVTRKTSQSSEELPVFSPASSLNGSFGGVEMEAVMANDSMPVETEPDNGWTVVDVDWNKYPKKKETVHSSNESTAKSPVSPATPKPSLAPKPKPKSPASDSGNSDQKFNFPVASANGNENHVASSQTKRPENPVVSNAERPKNVSDGGDIVKSQTESKKPSVPSPSGSIKSRMSLFESAGPVKPPLYAKPDLSKRTRAPKSPVREETTSAASPNVKDTSEAPPLLPDRLYSDEDLEPLNPTPNGLTECSSKSCGSLEISKRLEESSQKGTENLYSVVELGNVKPSSLIHKKTSATPSPPPHKKGFEHKRELPPIPPNRYRDRVSPPSAHKDNPSSASTPRPFNEEGESVYSEVKDMNGRSKDIIRTPPLWGKDLSNAASTSFSSKEEAESVYSKIDVTRRPNSESLFEARVPTPPLRGVSLSNASTPSPTEVESAYSVVDAMMGNIPRNESPYSEVENRCREPAEAQPYLTTDVLRNLPPKDGDQAFRQPPPKPRPYKEFVPPSALVDNEVTRPKPPMPAPYRSQNSPRDTSVSSTPDGHQVQSKVTTNSSHLPSVVPESPRHHSAKIVSGSTSSPPLINSSTKDTPPPPPLVASIEDVTQRLPLNFIENRGHVNEISSRDFNGVFTSRKPVLVPEPQHVATLDQVSQHNGPHGVKPLPPSEISSLVPEAYGSNAGSDISDHEREILAPPLMEWMSTVSRDERSTSATSVVDSLDIAPPPPLHFIELDTSTFEIDDIQPPPNWQEEIDKNGNVHNRALKKSDRITDFDLSIVPPPPPPSGPPPSVPVNGSLHSELDLVPSRLSDGIEGLNMDDILEDFDASFLLPPERFDGISDDEDPLPPPSLPNGDRYFGVPPPPGNTELKPLVPPLRKQR